jgi:glycosyltransferase involved in cell wall biosynthesis
VVIMGHVPNLRTLLDAVRLTAAPLRFGAGIKGKVLDSLAAGVPCAMSRIAAEALDLPDHLARLVGDGAAAMADAILTLHGNEAVHRAVARAGRAMVQRDNAPERVTQALAVAVKADASAAVA